MLKRKICVITGTRADYGLLQGLMQRIISDDALTLQVVASAMHLVADYDYTYRQIEADGFVIDRKVDMSLVGDTARDITRSVGKGTQIFADVLAELEPDIVVLLGDRFEALAAAQAAMFARIPIAHIHGGEITEGAVDDMIRHAITKLSTLHFVATDVYKRRVIQLGEQPSRVFVAGAPGIDNIKTMKLLPKDKLETEFGFELGKLSFLLTYHPATLSEQTTRLDNIIHALAEFPQAKIIITLPNADTGGKQLAEDAKAFFRSQPGRIYLTPSLGQLRYLSLLQYIDIVIGNSSSGLLEVPSFNKPTINIGDRQLGRQRAKSVIDCEDSTCAIFAAIHQALSDQFQQQLQEVVNPYGDGHANERILAVLKQVELLGVDRKTFFDIDYKLPLQ